MPLNGDNMGMEVSAAVQAVFAGMSQEQINGINADDVWKAVCNAIVTHITTNSQVVIPGAKSGPDTLNGTVT